VKNEAFFMYKLILAIRYLYRRRISYLALVAVALCVFIVVVVMTVMRGLVNDFKEKNHKYAGDCVVGTKSLVGFPYYEDFEKQLKATDFVEAVTAVVKSYALISAGGSTNSFGVELTGIEPESYSMVTGFGETLNYHKKDTAEAFKPKMEPNLPGCVVGADLWVQRNSRGGYYAEANPAATAISVTCFPLTVKGALAKAGTGLVNNKTFYFSDFSQSGLARVDSSVIYLPIKEVQVLCGMDEPIARASWIHIKFKAGMGVEESCRRVRQLWAKYIDETKGKADAQLLAGVNVLTWKEQRREFIAAMEKEQTALILMFGLVGLTTVFIVFVVFYMIVSHKTKDIGILKSVGASGSDVVTVFLGFAALLGAIGSVVGMTGGIWFLRNINAIEEWLYQRYGFQMWDRTIYSIGEIPHRLDWTMLMVIAGCAIAACIAGAIWPSVRAAAARPVETLQVSQI
jgi:lipoprotein-releasing system permease protein